MKNIKFLDTDHEISLDAAIAIINVELSWCYKNSMKSEISNDFRLGFITGLEQAKFLMIELATMEHGE